MKIPFHRPSIYEGERWAAEEILKSGWLTTGEQTRLFEEEFASYVGSKYAVFLNSCTSALHLAYQYKKMKHPEVQHRGALVPSLTFAATINELILLGYIPYFVDVSPDDLCVDYGEIIRHYSDSRIQLIVPVHYGGNEAKGVGMGITVFDSAHRIEKNSFNGCTTCYSFYPTKNMTTGEGGMICTNDEDEYKWLLKARHHGKSAAVGYGYEVEFIGSKYNNTDIAAAIGREQLRKLPQFTQDRNNIRDRYNAAFGLNWKGNHLYVVRVKDKNEFIRKMEEAGIGVSVHFKPLHLMKPYENFPKVGTLENTEQAYKEIVSLPLYPSLSSNDIDYIIEKVLETNLLIK